jgi:hypothetical protein
MGNYRKAVRTGFLGIAALMMAMLVLIPPTAEAGYKEHDKGYKDHAKRYDQVVVAGKMNWDNWSWDAKVAKETYDSNAYKLLGVKFKEEWAGLYLHHKGFDTKSYKSIQIHIRDIHSSLAAPMKYVKPKLPKLTLWLIDAEGNYSKPLHPEDYAVRFQDSYFMNIPLSELDCKDKIITGVVLQDRSGKVQHKFWVDSIVFK